MGLVYCRKENPKDTMSNGTIIGPDYSMCMSICCGGWNIQIDKVTYKFDSIPSNSAIDLQKESFPMQVKLNWYLAGKSNCPNKWIFIQKIEKIYLRN